MRIIDADKLYKDVKTECNQYGKPTIGVDDGNKVLDIIKRQPTIDAIAVVHAYWVYNPNGMDWNIGAWKCSKCGSRNMNLGGDNRINPKMFAGSRFCPNCGAKMDREDKA
jgi:ribosomal protein S27AE